MTECIVPILKGLRKNEHLVKIDLSWNGLEGELFFKTLRKLVLKNQTLSEIDLEFNRYVFNTYALLQV